MTYYVRVKQGHPTGVRRRAGLTFTQDESMISEDAMTDAIRTDAWLQVREIGAPSSADDRATAAAPSGNESSPQSEGNEGGSRRRRTH